MFIAAVEPGFVYEQFVRTGSTLRNTGGFEIFTVPSLAVDVRNIMEANDATVVTDGYGLSSTLDFYGGVPPVVIGYNAQGGEARRWYDPDMQPRRILFVDKESLYPRPGHPEDKGRPDYRAPARARLHAGLGRTDARLRVPRLLGSSRARAVVLHDLVRRAAAARAAHPAVGSALRCGRYRHVSERLPFALPGARPHYGPHRVVRVEHIDLHLRPVFATKTLHGEVATRVRAIENGVRTLRLDAVDLTIDGVREEDGAELAFTATAKDLTIDLRAPLAAGEAFTFVIAYRAIEPRRGLYFIDRPRQAWTQSQDTDARAWLPCFDHPAEKQTTSTTIVVEPGTFALGNGALVARTESAAAVTFRYEQTIPHATYLLTMVAGAFSEIEQVVRAFSGCLLCRAGPRSRR